jgi:hypothetical protein
MIEIDYAARVAKGAALLDEKRPGWEQLIDLEILDIESPTSCVTAQLSGQRHFRVGLAQLGLTGGSDGTYVSHGFNAEGDCDCCVSREVLDRLPEGYDQDAAYGTLNTLWKDLISKRLAEPADS